MNSSTKHNLWADYHKSRMIAHAFRLKKTKFSIKSSIRKHVRKYCMLSTIHGLSHTVDSEYSKIERIFWAIVTIVSLGVGALLAYLMLYRYSISPTITTVETYSYPTRKIPFPAVTLCNVNKVRKSSVRSIVEKLVIKGMNQSDAEHFFKMLTTLITRDKIEFSATDKAVQESVFQHINGTIDDIMRMVSQPCSELLVRCAWQSKFNDCYQLFRLSKSVEGYCCSFNYYPKTGNDVPIVDYIGGTGRKDGLTVTINVNSEDYFSTSDPYYGVKVLVHANDVFPETSILTEVVQPGKAVSLAINPYFVESEETVKDLKLSQRMCLFADEFPLKTVVEYDYEQCITECRVNIILTVCNCIPFIYPNKMNGSVICNLENALCMHTNAAYFSNLYPNDNDDDSETICSHCLPECSEIIYTSSSSVTNLFRTNLSLGTPMKENESLLHVYYEDISCIKYRREAMVTWDSLVASLGGIFGLCLGGSVLSIVELVYHFTFSFFKNIKNSKNRQQKTVPISHFIR